MKPFWDTILRIIYVCPSVLFFSEFLGLQKSKHDTWKGENKNPYQLLKIPSKVHAE